MKIEVKNLSFSYGKERILSNINFSSSCGESIAVLGPNGVGKSTFFKCLLGFLTPKEGEIRIDGRDIKTLKRKDLAQVIAYIPQSSRSVYNHTVLDSVAMGLTPSLSLFTIPGEKEKGIALKALEKMGIAHLANRGNRNISGGERQLMLIARALVQKAKIIIMDEPTANLDYGNTYRVMEMTRSLVAEGYTIIFSTHDPDFAMRYATRIVAFYKGEIIRDGDVKTSLTSDVLSTLYSINVALRDVSVRNMDYKICIPIGYDTIPSAGCVVFKGDEVLLVKFSKRIGFPKGHREKGERMEETALRETKEETGIDAQIINPIPFEVPSVRRGDYRSVYFYKAEYISGEITRQRGETDDVFWAKKEEVSALLSFEEDKKMFDEILKL